MFRVNLPSGEGDVSDSNSSEELESVIEESEPDQHIDFVSLGSTWTVATSKSLEIPEKLLRWIDAY